MRTLRSVFLSLVVILANQIAGAFPNGHREAYMANAGGALEASPGNFIYNPAGMGFRDLDKLSLSVSGNAVSVQKIEIPSFSSDTEAVNIRPLLATAVYPTDWGTAGVFLSSPSIIDSSISSEDVISGVNTTSTTSLRGQLLMGGAGFAGKLSSKLSWGVSSGVEMRSSDSSTYVAFRAAGLAQTNFSDLSEKVYRIFVLPGVLYRASETWNIGLSGIVRPITLSSVGKYYSSVLSSSNPTTIPQQSQSYDPSGTKWDYSLRLAQWFSLIEQNMFYVDVNWYSPNSKKSYNSTTEYEDSWSYNVGWRNLAHEKWEPLLGYQRTENTDSKTNMFTAGTVITRRRNEIGIGAFYYETLPKGNSNISEFKSYGVMFSSNVAY